MYNIFKLDNGLRIAAEQIDYVNSVSVGLWVQNGSRNEDIKNNGISHFIEHMLFKGTKKRNAKEIAESIENVGGQINAFTGKEATCFYIKVLNTHLDLSLDILSDMLFNSTFSEEEIEKEKRVIIEEILMNEDSPEDVLSDLHSKAIWGDDSITFPILGTENNVKSFNKEMLVNYLLSHYIPQNSVISIVGKFDIKKIEKKVEKYFGIWKSGKGDAIKYTSPEICNDVLFKKKKIEQLNMSLGIPGFGINNENIYTLLLLNNILGGSASSILFQKLREELGICYSVYSFVSSYKNTGIIGIYTALNSKYTVDVINIIKEEIYNFIKSGISVSQLSNAKEQLKGNYLLGLESTSSKMFSNGKSVLFLNMIKSPQYIINKIDSVDRDTINCVMENTFKKGIVNGAFVGNNFDKESIKNAFNNL